MSLAPVPGVGARREAAEQAKRVTTLTLRGQSYTIAEGNVPIRVKDWFIRQTGRSVEWLSSEERIGEVTIVALWYMARLLNGEPTLTWESVLDEWDAAAYTEDDIIVSIDTPTGGTDPEA